jgi:glyoxylase-like metal-dependent hydrolase (beta-lactamase superfamily II)
MPGWTPAALPYLQSSSQQASQPQQVLAVLITHGHPDHYAAATLFPKAEVLGGSGTTSHDARRRPALLDVREA